MSKEAPTLPTLDSMPGQVLAASHAQDPAVLLGSRPTTGAVCSDPVCIEFLGRQKVGYGMVVEGIAKFQALKFYFSGSEISSKIPCFAGNFWRIPQQAQALKFQNSGPAIWRIQPPPFHTPPFACLVRVSEIMSS